MISTKPNDQFRTPSDLFDRYNLIYGFTVDGAASKYDAKCHTWWGPDGSRGDFFDTNDSDWLGRRVWINPPYSMIPAFLDHATKFRYIADVICWLLPSWTDRAWYSKHFWLGGGPRPYTRIDFLPGRPKFLMPDGSRPLDKHGKPQGGKFASLVGVWYNPST